MLENMACSRPTVQPYGRRYRLPSLTRRRVFSVLLFSLPFVSTGCYQLGMICPSSMRGIRTLAIPMFQNGTLVPRTEALLADVTIRVFQADGTYKIVDEGKADGILQCKLTDVSRTPIFVSSTNWMTTKKFQLQILVTYCVLDRITRKILQHGAVTGATRYFVGTDLTSQERQALPMAARLMANALLGQLTEGW